MVVTDLYFDQLNGKRSSSIFQQHYNYFAKVSDAAALQNTDEDEFVSIQESHLVLRKTSIEDYCS